MNVAAVPAGVLTTSHTGGEMMYKLVGSAPAKSYTASSIR